MSPTLIYNGWIIRYNIKRKMFTLTNTLQTLPGQDQVDFSVMFQNHFAKVSRTIT